MSTWHAEVQYRADADPGQLKYLAGKAMMAHYNTAERVLRLREPMGNTDREQATDEARRWVRHMETQLDMVGVRPQLLRFQLESADAVLLRWAAGPLETAALLGVSTARVRQLGRDDPQFPKPVAELAGGRVYRADEVESYKRGRVPGKGGRTRKEP